MAKQYLVTKVGDQNVKLSNLSKVLYPASGIIKAEIIEYYAKIAPTILKYIGGRPLSLVRYPDGIEQHQFYTKDKPSWAPDWIKSVVLGKNIKEGKEGKDYIIPFKEADVVWLANLACLDIHPMQVKTPNFDKPDLFVFDLDPPQNAVFGSIKALAFELREFLEGYGYHAFVKTSGGKGLHVCVPIRPKWTHEEVIKSVKALAEAFRKEHPDMCTLSIKKTNRETKVLLDIYRNHEGQTTVAPYSTRGRPLATVSMPVTWERLKTVKHPSDFTIKNVPDVLATEGDAWSGFYSYEVDLHDHRKEHSPKKTTPKTEEPVTPKLAEYSAKRDFTKTNEPPPTKEETVGNRFVVQIHHATNLHYDLRLEMEGVLRSWAIPKGLPSEPGTKRLAIETEPHPLKYLDFEGVIPKEEYGGGKMWVFARGKFEMIKKEKKRLHFRLISPEIEAEWLLYNMKNDEWLIERKDTPKTDWLEKTLGPMLAIPSKEIPSNEEYSFEIKWDGIRAMISIDDKKIIIRSRSGQDITAKFPEIANPKNCRASTAILDGELVCLDEAGRPVFTDVISRLHTSGGAKIEALSKRKKAYFYAFDCLYLGGRSLLRDPLEKRQEWLQTILRKGGHFRMSEPMADGASLFEAAKLHNLEGIIAKKKGSLYYPGNRSVDWLKIKFRSTAECVILGYTKGQGERAPYFGALHLGEFVENALIYKGKVGTGFDIPKMEKILEELKSLNRSPKLFKQTTSDDKTSVWFEPLMYCEIEYASLTNKKTYREPVFMRLRPDLFKK